jgi:hypothetical protein
MAVTLNASTTTGLVQSADTSGIIELQSNGTTKATVSSSGLAIGQYNPSASLVTSGTAVASTSGTSIDFTSIPSWAKRITILLHRVSTTGTVPLMYQLGTSSGIVTTGYVSSGAYAGDSMAGTTSTSGLLNGAGGATADTAVGLTTICNFGGNTWVSSSVCGDGNSNFAKMGGGSITLGSTLDRVRITTTTGTPTFDAGSINILYE